MQKVFRNANVVDIRNQKLHFMDFCVEDGKFSIFDSTKEFEEIDLKGNYVLPPFANNYCNSILALKNSYGIEIAGEDLAQDAENLMIAKNILAGATFVGDVASTAFENRFLTDISSWSEVELGELCDEVAKDKKTLFIKAGQDLDELGAINKTYDKTLSEVLEDFGLLDRKAILVGGNCLEKDELQLLKNYDTGFVVVPNEDARMGRRATNWVALDALEFDIGMGSGDVSEIDFFAFMRTLLASQRMMFENADIISEKEAMLIATNNLLTEGAEDLKMGKFADFCVVEKGEALYQNPLKDIVYGKSKKDVKMTVAKGEILQENGKILMKNLPQYDKIINGIQQKLRRN